MNIEVILRDLKEQFTLKSLIKSYTAQKEKILPNKIVVRVIKIADPVQIKNKHYLRFILSDDVNTISILLLESNISLKQKKILIHSLSYNEPVIISNLRKLNTPDLEIPQSLEVSHEILPIGTIIEPLNIYDPQTINEFFFKRADKRNKLVVTEKTRDSGFVTASDLLVKAETVPIAASNNSIFASKEELIDYFREHKSSWITCFALAIKKVQSKKFKQLSYIIEIPIEKNKEFTSKLKIIGLEEKNTSWIKIFEIKLTRKEFYETVKNNLDAFGSIEMLISLMNIGE